MLVRCELVLVETAHADNLGSVARLLDNFGAPAWTLVAPRAAVDDARAAVAARTARGRLTEARVVASLDEALGECSYVVGFSARRGSERPTVELRRLGAHLARHAPAGRVALVFGPEQSGLDGAAIAACDAVAVIDTPGTLPSLNLTHAVAVALWELAARAEATAGRSGDDRERESGGGHAAEAATADAMTDGRNPGELRLTERKTAHREHSVQIPQAQWGHAASEAAELGTREKAERELAEPEQAEWEQAPREHLEHASREQSPREQAPLEQPPRENLVQTQRDAAEASSRESAERAPPDRPESAGETPAHAPQAPPDRHHAKRAELTAFVTHVARLLDGNGYFRDAHERARSEVHWRRVLADAALRSDDVRALHRLCDALTRSHR